MTDAPDDAPESAARGEDGGPPESPARGEDGGPPEDRAGAPADSAGYFRERETHCRNRAEECGRPERRSTYLGFAARYAALARGLEDEYADGAVKLTIV